MPESGRIPVKAWPRVADSTLLLLAQEVLVVRDQRGEPALAPGPARELVDLFRRLRRGDRTSLGQIAVQTGLSPGHISEVLRGWKAPSPRAAVAIARALGADNAAALKVRRLASDLAELNRYNRIRAAAEDRAARPDPSPSSRRAWACRRRNSGTRSSSPWVGNSS